MGIKIIRLNKGCQEEIVRGRVDIHKCVICMLKSTMSINRYLLTSRHFSTWSENKGKRGGEEISVGLRGAGYKCHSTASMLYELEAVVLIPERASVSPGGM